jgi:hypothetical protein
MGLTNNHKMKLRRLRNKNVAKPSKLSPAQLVKKDFGSKKELAAKVMPLIEKKANETEEEFKSRIETLSNKKLLKLLRVGTEVSEKFQTKEELVNAVYKTAHQDSGKIDNDYLNKLKTFSLGKLLDMNKYYRRNK